MSENPRLFSALAIVGCNKAGLQGRCEARVDDDDSDLAAHAAADQVFHHLLLAVVFLEWAFPDDGDADALSGEFTLGLDGLSIDGLPELVRRAFGAYGNGVGLGGEGERREV